MVVFVGDNDPVPAVHFDPERQVKYPGQSTGETEGRFRSTKARALTLVITSLNPEVVPVGNRNSTITGETDASGRIELSQVKPLAAKTAHVLEFDLGLCQRRKSVTGAIATSSDDQSRAGKVRVRLEISPWVLNIINCLVSYCIFAVWGVPDSRLFQTPGYCFACIQNPIFQMTMDSGMPRII